MNLVHPMSGDTKTKVDGGSSQNLLD